jgi:nitrogen regulatory protein PII
MVKIEAVIQPFKLDEVKAALEGIGVECTTTSEALEHGARAAHKGFYRGAEYRIDSPRVKVEIVTFADRADEVIEALSRAARTRASADDGVILVYEVADAIRISTGARLQFARA